MLLLIVEKNMDAVISALSFSSHLFYLLALSTNALSSSGLALNIKSCKYVFWKSVAQHIFVLVRLIKIYQEICYLIKIPKKRKNQSHLSNVSTNLLYVMVHRKTYCLHYFLSQLHSRGFIRIWNMSTYFL